MVLLSANSSTMGIVRFPWQLHSVAVATMTAITRSYKALNGNIYMHTHRTSAWISVSIRLISINVCMQMNSYDAVYSYIYHMHAKWWTNWSTAKCSFMQWKKWILFKKHKHKQSRASLILWRLRTANTLPVHLFVATVASRRAYRVCICIYRSDIWGNVANYFLNPMAFFKCPFGLLSPLCLNYLTISFNLNIIWPWLAQFVLVSFRRPLRVPYSCLFFP